MSNLVSMVAADGILKIGSTGSAVQQAQLRLRGLGYPLNGTGYYGSATDVAVADFQKHHGLIPDGEIGSKTAAVLDAAPSAMPQPAVLARSASEVSRPLWLAVSLANVGLREAPGAADNPELIRDIQEVAKDYFHDSTPWCAGWVSFCLARAGEKPSKSPLWALSYADGWGVKLAGPAVGAIAVKHRSGGGHVTFVAGRTSSGRLACCGGNQNDMVSVSGYPESAFDGFYWPKDVAVPAGIGFAALPIVNAAGKVVSES